MHFYIYLFFSTECVCVCIFVCTTCLRLSSDDISKELKTNTLPGFERQTTFTAGALSQRCKVRAMIDATCGVNTCPLQITTLGVDCPPLFDPNECHLVRTMPPERQLPSFDTLSANVRFYPFGPPAIVYTPVSLWWVFD